MCGVEAKAATCCFSGPVSSILEWENELVEMLNNARCTVDGMRALTGCCVNSIEKRVEINNVKISAPNSACLNVVPQE